MTKKSNPLKALESEEEFVDSDYDSDLSMAESEVESDIQSSSSVSIKQKTSSDVKRNQASVFSHILSDNKGNNIKPQPDDDTVLSRRKKLLSAPEEEALLKRAQSILRKEKRTVIRALRVKPNLQMPDELSRERTLRKLATRATVLLFNSLHKHMQSTRITAGGVKGAKDENKSKESGDVTKTDKKQVDFMALLKTGPSKII